MAKGFGGLGQMGNLVKQAQKMQREMARVQQELKERIVEGTAGGGVVRAQVNGPLEVVALKIDPESVDPDDVEMLEDLVMAAVSQAMKKARAMSDEAMAKVTGGMGMPGLPGML